MKSKKKIILSSFFSILTATSITSIAVACSKNDKNETKQTTQQPPNNSQNNQSNDEVSFSSGFKVHQTEDQKGVFEFRSNYTQQEIDFYNQKTNEWLKQKEEEINTLTPYKADNYNELIKKNYKFATTKDSGQQDQSDIAYAFGIAPDYVSYKIKGADYSSSAPLYLLDMINEDPNASNYSQAVSFGRGSKAKPEEFETRNIGFILTTSSNFLQYTQHLQGHTPVLAGITAQSRSATASSQRPSRILPNWLFWNKEYDNFTVNPNLALDPQAAKNGRTDLFIDPYDAFILSGKTFDRVYDASKFDNVKNATVGDKTGFSSFEEYATKVAQTTRQKIKQWVNSSNNKWENKSVVVLSTPVSGKSAKVHSADFNQETNFDILNKTYAYQPQFFPILYGFKHDEFTPGLNMRFPIPKKNISQIQALVDNYGWIGGKRISEEDSDRSTNVSSILAEGFENTTDIVIYTYNPQYVSGFDGTKNTLDVLKQYEQSIGDYVDSLTLETKNQFTATKYLKQKPQYNKNFFIIPKDNSYDASLGILGQGYFANLINKAMNEDAEDYDFGLPKFNKNTTKYIRAFKNN